MRVAQVTEEPEVGAPFLLQAARQISVIVPDDGTDGQLMQKLLRDKGITRAFSMPHRAVSALRAAHTKRGKLPESLPARVVTIIVAEREADEVYDFVYENADIHRPGGGMLLMSLLPGATSFELPAGVPDELAH